MSGSTAVGCPGERHALAVVLAGLALNAAVRTGFTPLAHLPAAAMALMTGTGLVGAAMPPSSPGLLIGAWAGGLATCGPGPRCGSAPPGRRGPRHAAPGAPPPPQAGDGLPAPAAEPAAGRVCGAG
ncbi:hypothetical protein [Marinitenerispora sediminis]|uniref:hypothetical protein n=1 Tax=Marinitenerispora sediminis TaxID=1931232 RepID=UPI0011C04255|nr:hypothetical protein [Marinitenerispora sediminis]